LANWAVDFAPWLILVNAISAGPVETALALAA
jgi:hypothetical protein